MQMFDCEYAEDLNDYDMYEARRELKALRRKKREREIEMEETGIILDEEHQEIPY